MVWDTEYAKASIEDFDKLSHEQAIDLLETLNREFPPEEYEKEKECLLNAFNNRERRRDLLQKGIQGFPVCVDPETGSAPEKERISKTAVLLTAGGEGQRLKESLKQNGVSNEALADITKATYPVADSPGKPGTLHIDLLLIAGICRETGTDIPVIVSTGPAGSNTAEIIPEILRKNRGFGIKNLKSIAQGKRLHLSNNKKIVWYMKEGTPQPVTNPDETGGPVARMQRREGGEKESPISWLKRLGIEHLLVLQGTAVYKKEFIYSLIKAFPESDGIAAGIPRKSFPEDDPYGTLLTIEHNSKKSLKIIEKDERDSETRSLKNLEDKTYLPFNTGLYRFSLRMLNEKRLPDYITPPKEILPGIQKAPKCGFAATDIISLAENPCVIKIAPDSFSVLKKKSDITEINRTYNESGIREICIRESEELNQ